MLTFIAILKLCQNKNELKVMLQYWGLIPIEGEYLCRRCNNVLKLCSDDESLEKWYWWCEKINSHKKSCSYRVCIRSGTIFSNSKLSIFQILGLSHFWLKNISFEIITIELDITYETAMNCARFCSEVILQSFLQNPQKIGGPDKIIEIYETKLGKVKCYEGDDAEGSFVFGGFERGTGKIFMVIVKQHDSDNLIPIIEQWVEKGTIIIADFLKSSNFLTDPKYKLFCENHSITFKDDKCQAKTVTLAKFHKNVKSAGDLAKYLFSKKCDDLKADSTEAYFKLAGKLYNPRNNEQNIAEDDEFYLSEGIKTEYVEVKKEDEEDETEYDEFYSIEGVKKEDEELDKEDEMDDKEDVKLF